MDNYMKMYVVTGPEGASALIPEDTVKGAAKDDGLELAEAACELSGFGGGAECKGTVDVDGEHIWSLNDGPFISNF